MWSDNVCGDLNDLCKRGFLTKTNQNMCDCVLCFSSIEKQSDRNLVRGRGKFNVYEEIISLQFTVHDTSHHICKQCLKTTKAAWTSHQAGISKPAKETKGLFTWSGGPRSIGVGFFCFHALGDIKQKKPTPLDRGPPLYVNRVLNLYLAVTNRGQKNLNTLQLHLKSNPIGNTHRSINHRK